jgi:hypothetical protein
MRVVVRVTRHWRGIDILYPYNRLRGRLRGNRGTERHNKLSALRLSAFLFRSSSLAGMERDGLLRNAGHHRPWDAAQAWPSIPGAAISDPACWPSFGPPPRASGSRRPDLRQPVPRRLPGRRPWSDADGGGPRRQRRRQSIHRPRGRVHRSPRAPGPRIGPPATAAPPSAIWSPPQVASFRPLPSRTQPVRSASPATKTTAIGIYNMFDFGNRLAATGKDTAELAYPGPGLPELRPPPAAGALVAGLVKLQVRRSARRPELPPTAAALMSRVSPAAGVPSPAAPDMVYTVRHRPAAARLAASAQPSAGGGRRHGRGPLRRPRPRTRSPAG